MARSSNQSENKAAEPAEVKDEDVVGEPRQTKATPLEAAEPVEMPASFGATFAERAKARKS